MRWIEGQAGTRFFLFLHLYDLHTPYNLPRATRVPFKDAGYLAELGYVDRVLGQFWKFLARRGLMDKALIVFTSDHGESLGDHGEDTHGYFIYQSTVWVPLIIHWPVPTRPLPARVEEPASLLDVAPTILQALGISSPQPFQGRSLLNRPDGRPHDPEVVYSESLYGRNHFGVSALLSVRVGRHKYIEAPRPELYDLAADPGEVHNLYEKQRSVALGLRSRLLALRSRLPRERAPEPTQPTPEVVANLRSLGYLGGGRAATTSSESAVNPADRIVDFRQFGRAIALASSGRLLEANVLLGELLRKDGRLVDVRIALGLNKQKMGRQAEAVEQFRNVLQQDSLNVLAHFNLAVSYFALRQFDGAIKELQLTLGLAPYYTRAEELWANIHLQQNDYAQARVHFMRILTVAPADYAAHYNLGILDMSGGQLHDAEHHLRQAVDADPLAAEARNALGSCYLQQGDLNRARDELLKGVRLNPKSPVSHYNLGLALRRLGLTKEAIWEFQLALAADPQFQPARAALDQLRHIAGK
jgi:tetratricopeptide (TPR) repeat protein